MSYDPLGRFYRLAKDGGIDRWFLYDGLDMVGQHTASGTLVYRYVFGDTLGLR